MEHSVGVIFDDGTRTYEGPADYGESRRRILDRSARPEMREARERIEACSERLCPAMQAGVGERLRSDDDQQFTAGLWELYLHEVFTRLGYDVTCAAPVSNGRDIDFLLRRGGVAFYLEATIATRSRAERAADARRNRIFQEVNRLETDFTLGVTVDSAGTADARDLGGLREGLQDWVDALDHDEAERSLSAFGEGPSMTWTDGSWSLVFEAFPARLEYRGHRTSRPLGMIMDETGGLIDDERPLRRALERKRASRYGDLTLPYVVAVAEEPFSSSDEAWHRTNLLFGHEAVAYGDGRPARLVRQSDGIWRGPGPASRNRRLAAVLFTSDLAPWSIDRTVLEWWDNPVANLPVPDEAVPEVARRCRLSVGPDGVEDLTLAEPDRTPGVLLTD